MKLRHERLAEAHDLAVRTAPGIEVGAAFAPADRHPGQCVLKGLLEAEELDDSDIHRRMKPDPALVRPECGVELNPEPPVDLDLALVVHPGHAEDDLTLRFADPLDERVFGVTGMFGYHAPEALQDLAHGLVKLVFTSVTPQDFG